MFASACLCFLMADAPLKLPAEVVGRPGRLIVVQAETAAPLVRWYAAAGPDKPDLWPTPDGKTLLFCSPTPGRYTLLAWTALDGKPTEAVTCTVVVGEPPPPDPFVAELSAAWRAEAAPDRRTQRDSLAAVYRAAANETADRPTLKTVGDLFAALQVAARTSLPAEALTKTRAALGAEFRRTLPTDPAAMLDAATRTRCKQQFERAAKALEALP